MLPFIIINDFAAVDELFGAYPIGPTAIAQRESAMIITVDADVGCTRPAIHIVVIAAGARRGVQRIWRFMIGHLKQSFREKI
ncbi:MAG: hypothetical protein C7B46_18175 [Sulfobacillus benefaciens]|uniref:Uncharacterized protein n=1 Tax=Sulfobacillus benefaciens TaxID=453960 RepID=A0A2T2X6N5_9FIRM|nr:MAG: hypothetical protein C7B46_18175 [Sulfobacillus benefaciens]